jgi:hypothetical protein
VDRTTWCHWISIRQASRSVTATLRAGGTRSTSGDDYLAPTQAARRRDMANAVIPAATSTIPKINHPQGLHSETHWVAALEVHTRPGPCRFNHATYRGTAPAPLRAPYPAAERPAGLASRTNIMTTATTMAMGPTVNAPSRPTASAAPTTTHPT